MISSAPVPLALAPSGVHIVTTAHSSYVVDADSKTVTRHKGEASPSELRGDGEAQPYDSVLVVNGCLFVTLPAGRWIQSTPIVAIDAAA